MTYAHSRPVLFAARRPGLAHGAGYTLLCVFAAASATACARGQHTTEKGPVQGTLFPGGAGGVSAAAGTSAYGVTTGGAGTLSIPPVQNGAREAGAGGAAALGAGRGGRAGGGDPMTGVDAGVGDDAGRPTPNGTRWQPEPGTSWQWQLTGRLDTSFDVEVYDIDLYNTSTAEIDGLHTAGRKVVCYFDTAYEPSRPDSDQLEPYRGNPIDGWPGQYWVDFREDAVVDVMKARIAIAAEKGCDGIEADDIDARSNDPGFDISASEQRAFIKALADAAHAAGLAFGLKNDLEDVDALLEVSDFAINEECFEYDECEALTPFIAAGKAVFHVEYTDGDLEAKGAQICPGANELGFDTLIKHLDLDAERYSCQ